jgi:hypothetical protein
MPQRALKEQLEALHATLKNTPELNEDEHELLLKIASDIAELEGSDSEPADISDMIQEQVIRFDQDYPALSAVLRQLTDTLGRIGV